MLLRFTLLLPIVLTLLSGCTTIGLSQSAEPEAVLKKPAQEIAEAELLDVWVELFSPGTLPEDKEDAAGLSLEIRKAEARYMPVQLRDTMAKTGYWGAVRVVPQGNQGGELLVKGMINSSDGETVELRITALDAVGREWFSRDYDAEVTVNDYKKSERSARDVYQPLYNTIANDLAEYRSSLKPKEITKIRRVAALRFAANLAPDAFASYIQKKDGEYKVIRLPSDDDPVFQRANKIRDRDFLLVDTLNGHFDNFNKNMQLPYTQWRKTRLDEVLALREIETEARNKKLLGAAAIIAAIGVQFLGGSENQGAANVASSVLVIGGATALKSGFDKDAETTIHRGAITELGNSFAAEAEPLVIEVEGETHELTGSAEIQYKKWQSLMKRIYATETGLPVAETIPQ